VLWQGGGIFIDGGTNNTEAAPLIEFNVLRSCTATWCGAGIEIDGVNGGGGTDATIRHNILRNNPNGGTADNGFGLELWTEATSDDYCSQRMGDFYNNIIIGFYNTRDYVIDSSDIWAWARNSTDYSFISDRWNTGRWLYDGCYRYDNPNNHNVFGTDPMFVDEGNRDYHLRPGSPCIGTGRGGIDIGLFPSQQNGDTQPPVISNVSSGNITSTSATITWSTDELSDSQVEYGLNTSYGNIIPLDSTLTLNHSVLFSGLSANTTYHYRVRSRDAAGNLAVSEDYSFFTTQQTAAWWNSGYAYCKQLTISAPSGRTIYTGYPLKLEFDHASLVSAGKSQAGGNDLRVVYKNGSNWVEVNRALFNNGISSSSWNQNNTTIIFKAQAQITGGSSDQAYYLYYGNPSASSPPTNTLSSRYFLAESLGETQTTSTSYASKVQLQFTPSATSEHWVVVATWRQRHVGGLGSENYAGRGRVSVNGVPRTGTSDITYKMSGDLWKTFQGFFKVTGTTSKHTISVDFRADGGTDAIDRARIIAFMIPDPSDANIQYSETLGKLTDITPTDCQTVTFTPSSAGDYIWMANGFHREGPGGDGWCLGALDENGIPQQESGETYIDGEAVFVPLVHFERRHLTATSKSFKIRALGPDPTKGSDRQGLTQLLFRADVFDAIEAASSPNSEGTNSTAYVTKNTLTTGSVNSGRDYVYLVVMGTDNESFRNITVSNFAEIRLGGIQELEEEVAIDRASYGRQIAWAYGETGMGNRIIDTRYRNEVGGADETIAQNAHILSLRYIESSNSSGVEVSATQGGDTQAPAISNVASSGLTSSSALITWSSSELSDSQVEYGLNTSYGSMSLLDTYLVQNHGVTLSGLNPNTTYHYRVRSKDAAGNLAVSGDFSFTTAPAGDTRAPVISNVASSGITSSSATITWSTDELSDSQVEFGLNTSYGSLTALDPTSVKNHSMMLSSLIANTAYHYRVKSKDAAGNLAISGDYSFTTPAQQPTDWWNSSYACRKQLTITAPSGKTVYGGYPVKLRFDHASLVSAGKSQADGDDIRVLYKNGSNWVEVDRVLTNNGLSSSSWNQRDTAIVFKTQSSISGGGSDGAYYLYYGNTSAVNPPTNTLPSRYFIAESLGETQTTSTSYASKVQLQFTPSATSEQWVVVATWRQRHVGGLGSENYAGRGRVSINGSPRPGTSELTYYMSGNIWKTFQAFFRVTGTTSAQKVSLDFRADGGLDGIDNARIVAFLIPNPA
jgi:hypothetical protein